MPAAYPSSNSRCKCCKLKFVLELICMDGFFIMLCNTIHSSKKKKKEIKFIVKKELCICAYFIDQLLLAAYSVGCINY